MPDSVKLNAKYSTAITGKGLWPLIKKLADNSLGVFIYNKPAHGYENGDVELYCSRDSGKSWQLRSQVSEHADNPEHVRMNVAAGINLEGHIVVIVSGWSEGRKHPLLKCQICISKDNGLSWERKIWNTKERNYIPFGDMVTDENGNITVPLYARGKAEGRTDFYLSRSKDGGNTWNEPERVLEDLNEITILKTSSGKWLAVGRQIMNNSFKNPSPLILCSSKDGVKWKKKEILTKPEQIPGHIMELHDGRLLVSYGSRIIGLCGVQAIISNDEGLTWSAPATLLSYQGPSDCGYPSTVELDNGKLLTVFYAGNAPHRTGLSGLPLHPEYHMGILEWTTDIFQNPKTVTI